MYILYFLSIVCTGWYFHEHLFGEGSVRLKGGKLPEVKKDNENVLIGKSQKGLVFHNFLKYPHLLVAGHTGYGKTNFIRTILEQIEGEIILIELKRGDDYPAEMITANNVTTASEVLMEVVGRMRTKRKDHVFVVIDEAFEFVVPKWAKTKEEKEPYLKSQFALSEIARLGRSFNVHLIYATQYPTSDVFDPQVKQNMESRVVFRLPTGYASRVALDDEGAEELPAGVKGRAIYKTDVNQIIQTFEMEGVEHENKNGNEKDQRKPDTFTIG